jgi:hypothetical protein
VDFQEKVNTPSCSHAKKSKTFAADVANLHGFFLKFVSIRVIRGKKRLLGVIGFQGGSLR